MTLATPHGNGARELASGFDAALGTEIASATGQEVVLRLELQHHHLQPYGVVHGGVWAALAETAASIGASVNSGHPVVGLENHTSFLRAIQAGAVLIVARPLHPGRSTQVWEVEITEEGGPSEVRVRPVAHSTVRLFVLARDGLVPAAEDTAGGSPEGS